MNLKKLFNLFFIKSNLKDSENNLQLKYPQYEIGRGTYGNLKVLTWNEGANLKIGSFCSIADGVRIFLGGEHRLDWVTTYPFNILWDEAKLIPGHPKTKGDVIIGNDVWIGFNAVILSGVTIGHGAVIGAGSVVSRNIEPYEIHAGNPARFVRKRFDDLIIRQLLELKWWDFDDDQIKKMLPLMLSDNIENFISYALKQKQTF